jgi:hypothetical protein
LNVIKINMDKKKYVQWCNDSPFKSIFKQVIGACGGKVYQGNLDFELPHKRLEDIKKIVANEALSLDPKLKAYFLSKDYTSEVFRTPRTMQEFNISTWIKTDILAYKDEAILAMELKSRLFHLINSGLRKKNDEMMYYDHYHIKYHFGALVSSYNAYLNTLAFKEFFQNNGRLFSESLNAIGEAAELFRYCLVLDIPDFYNTIFKVLFDKPEIPIKYRFVGLGVPNYVSEAQEGAILDSMKELKSDLPRLKFIHEIDLFLCNIVPLMAPGDEDPHGFKFELIPLFEDKKKEEVLKGMLNCAPVYNLDFRDPGIRRKYERESAKWRACTACAYYKNCLKEETFGGT